MNVLKIATAGSVDDGKSTLIGRVLYDTKSLTDDKLEAISRSSKQKGLDYLDFSLATDGLVAEREQGITIDVAHIYFSTAHRSFIIADTPGHIEYTRNMVTGASTSQASIILIDARNGVVEQTYRHFFINNLLRVKDVVIAVNKMDLVDFSETHFQEIKEQIEALARKSGYTGQQLTFIPLSALEGDNVVFTSKKMSWYSGVTLLEHLEKINVEDIEETAQARFSVQTVIRPKTKDYHDFRGYAGKVYGGDIAVGDTVRILPSETISTVKGIHFFEKEYQKAVRGSSVTLTLTDDVHISRGNVLVKENELPEVSKELTATICWMDSTPLKAGLKYIVQHGIRDVQAKVSKIAQLIHTDFSGTEENPMALTLNQIGEVTLKLNKELFYDTYATNKSNGAFILIDPKTNTTSGVGFIK